MTAVVNEVIRGAIVASNVCLNTFLLKKILECANYVVKTVFKSTKPEQFVTALMGKAPNLLNRFVHLIDWKIGVVAGVISLASWRYWKELNRIFGEPSYIAEVLFLCTHPITYLD